MVSEKCKCGNKLTEEEFGNYGHCMLCHMKALRKKCEAIGIPYLEVDCEDFGRTEEEKKEFQEYLDSHPELYKGNGPSIPGRPTMNNDKDHDDQISALGISRPKELKKIVAGGANEDVKLTFEFPENYHVNSQYYKEIQIMMNAYLEVMLHFLAFGPLAEKGLEVFLAEKLGLNKKDM